MRVNCIASFLSLCGDCPSADVSYIFVFITAACFVVGRSTSLKPSPGSTHIVACLQRYTVDNLNITQKGYAKGIFTVRDKEPC
jgi:hypothetical protein